MDCIKCLQHEFNLRSVIRHERIAPFYPSPSAQSTEKQLSAETETPFVYYLNHMHLDHVEETIKCKFDLTEIELQEQNKKKYEILSYNGCKCKDFYEKDSKHFERRNQFIENGMNIFITLFAFIAIMQQFSVDSNEFSNNGRRIHFQNYFQRMQKRLDPQYFQLGFGKRFIVNDENYPTNMQCCAHTLSSELLKIAKQNLLSEESVEITEEYY
ncbi:hypothetical protein T02_5043 [Trichinella nativa]|uniref:Uncharacterized protein n=1 Tax=Trichinella nativa TaxID=6335 RepID=A0A0V1LQB8_9BILA|nr:hypothetical protein T02_5043 [Trichinella nativa]